MIQCILLFNSGSACLRQLLQSTQVWVSLAILTAAALATIDGSAQYANAHDGHGAVTYEVSEPLTEPYDKVHLRLLITDEADEPIAARFTLSVDGKPFVPSQVGDNGLRFMSVHEGKGNRFVATYARGNGPVVVPLPKGLRGTVTAAHGFEYVSSSESFEIGNGSVDCHVRLRRWSKLANEGWQAADEHVHYDRTDRRFDADWLKMLEADGLAHAHFLVLKGGNVPDIWARQYAFGSAGEAGNAKQFIRSGEEYRDSSQGHINLLGLKEVIQPISTGGLVKSNTFNYPPLFDVFRAAHQQGAIGGPAHGGALAKSSTALLDTVLGEVDFFEIANSHLYKTDVWYLLLNCGFILPPVAGTDLPNFGYRDPWQPLFGEVRTYVQMGSESGFEAWQAALKSGKVFVTSGPLLHFTINDLPVGSVVRLPKGGGPIDVVAELQSPRVLESLELVCMGQPVRVTATPSTNDGITCLSLNHRLNITESCWLAVRGTGGPKIAIEQGLSIDQHEIAHSGIIQVLVDNQPIRSTADTASLRTRLVEQQEFYRAQGRFESPDDRRRFIELFETAITKLEN
ncbi:MAG: CehA/McbA family metallohydrolase [Planctomycetales bacterium]|nr:CehA/McbA family metallohydrolase [Planctomycetales bacterium]